MEKMFGTSGIRGVFGKEITPELAASVGLALGSQFEGGKVLVGRDPRTSSTILENALISGLESAGIGALKTGITPTPVLAKEIKEQNCKAGAMITASHNPPEYNGIKLWQKNSMAFTPELEEKIENTIKEEKYKRENWKKIGKSEELNITDNYISEIKTQVKIKDRFKIAVDCGGGANSAISPLILSEFAHGLTKIFCEFDGTFSNRNSEPIEENLSALKKAVWNGKEAVGFAHDGDGDRLAVVDELGRFVKKDDLLAILAENEMDRGGQVVVPVDTSKVVWDIVSKNKGEVKMCKVGDVSVAEKLEKSKADFGGEPSGSFIFPKFSLAPDGILASLKVLEIMSREDKSLSEIVDELPDYETIRKTINCKNKDKEKVVEKYSKKLKKLDSVKKETEIDGFRVDLEDSWVLVRASGTEPKVRITVESAEEKRAKELLKEIL